MAQIAVPVLLLGSAYIISNTNQNKQRRPKNAGGNNTKSSREGFMMLNDPVYNGQSIFDPNENAVVVPYADYTHDSTGSPDYLFSKDYKQQNIRREQIRNADYSNKLMNRMTEKEDEMVMTLAGVPIRSEDFGHNNMKAYYTNKSSLNDDFQMQAILDMHTGTQSLSIEKTEQSNLPPPAKNMGYVYGTPNFVDEYRDRVVLSNKRDGVSCTDSIQVGPGIGLGDHGESVGGYNQHLYKRDLYTAPTVDELRTANNPKISYNVSEFNGPKKGITQNRGIIGRVEKRLPDTYFNNGSMLGSVATSANNKGMKQTASIKEIMPDQSRQYTGNTKYFGGRGRVGAEKSYVKGKYKESTKQQLKTNPFINLSSKDVNKVDIFGYGRDTIDITDNNRSTTDNASAFGVMSGIVGNLFNPVISSLRYSKKGESVLNANESGNASMMWGEQSTDRDTDFQRHITNREMIATDEQLKHMNVQGVQANNGYINAAFKVDRTQRESTIHDTILPAYASGAQSMPDDGAYWDKTRLNDKVHATNVKGNGGMGLLNHHMNVRTVNRERVNTTAPLASQLSLSGESCLVDRENVMGSYRQGQYDSEYVTNMDDRMDDTILLEAYKNNPYIAASNGTLQR